MKSHLLISPVIAWLLFSCSSPEAYVVQRKDLVQAVYASGEVRPVDFYEVTSKTAGIVDSIYVAVGQTVAAGDPLLKIQSPTSRLNLQTAANLYELARNNAQEHSDRLSRLSRQVATAYATYQLDSVDYERYARLNEQGIGSEQTFEQARLRFLSSRNNYLSARSNLQDTREQLQVELRNARNNYLSQQSLLSDYLLVAAISGKVYDVIPQAGELVSSNRPVIELGAADSFEVEMLVDETDIILISPGQPVVFALDALEDTVLHGTVRRRYPRVNPVDKTVKVIASIDPAGYDLYLGMSLEANIIIREKKDILVVPVEYVSMDGTVIVKQGNKGASVTVRTGIRDLQYAEILSGLAEGDRIIKP
jgi:multidrug efflux pump subunit AcrA (membrane-fusion protein)